MDQQKCRVNQRQHQLEVWIRAINALDPFVHRAMFQYVRALRLRQRHFEEDCVVALDGAANAACQLVRDRLQLRAGTRENAYVALGLSKADIRVLEDLYVLRSTFGAHPGMTKWWDFAELFEEETSMFVSTTQRLLWRLCCFEQTHRVVDMYPTS